MHILCIDASNICHTQEGTSSRLCGLIDEKAVQLVAGVDVESIHLKAYDLHPCTGCGDCFTRHRCTQKDDFNQIYQHIIASDVLFIVAPHYAPIPAKLCCLLEKMEQISFLPWAKDNSYRAEVAHLRAGVISHGGAGVWAVRQYKAMVNDTIANALDTIQIRLVGLDEEWPTGIVVPVQRVGTEAGSPFPRQEYDWEEVGWQVETYMKRVLDEGRE